jgi:hypothetical protein
VIFVLTGVIVAGRIYSSEHSGDNIIQGRDYGYAFLLWVYLLVRACMSGGSGPGLALRTACLGSGRVMWEAVQPYLSASRTSVGLRRGADQNGAKCNGSDLRCCPSVCACACMGGWWGAQQEQLSFFGCGCRLKRAW